MDNARAHRHHRIRPETRQQRQEAAHFALCKGKVRVTCVVDGDTIWFQGDKIRIADINAPKSADPQCDYEEELGDKARDRLMGCSTPAPSRW
jgi:endonuclease YncB( thermonuclease family)